MSLFRPTETEKGPGGFRVESSTHWAFLLFEEVTWRCDLGLNRTGAKLHRSYGLNPVHALCTALDKLGCEPVPKPDLDFQVIPTNAERQEENHG